MGFKEFYTCPSCGRAISGEKKEFFVCPNCGRALCQKKGLMIIFVGIVDMNWPAPKKKRWRWSGKTVNTNLRLPSNK